MDFDPFGAFGMFSIMGFIIPLFFMFIFGMLIFTVVRGIMQWNYNNHQPVLKVDAIIVAKRSHTSHHHHHDHNSISHSTSSTSYYVTFEVESGDRMEFGLSDTEYGMLAEGDRGKLTFQGTRYLGFERVRNI